MTNLSGTYIAVIPNLDVEDNEFVIFLESLNLHFGPKWTK